MKTLFAVLLLFSSMLAQNLPPTYLPAFVIRAERALPTCNYLPALPDPAWPNNPYHCTFAFVDTENTIWGCPNGYTLLDGSAGNQRWCKLAPKGSK